MYSKKKGGFCLLAILFLTTQALAITTETNIACSDALCIEEYTEIGILENKVYLKITDQHSKEDSLNISADFLSHEITNSFIYSTAEIFDSYTVPIYGLVNQSVGKCKTINVIANETECIFDNGDTLICNYILPDNSCLFLEKQQIGNITDHKYFPITSRTQSTSIDGGKVKFKEGLIPIPKDGEINIRLTMQHPLFYNLLAPDVIKKYDYTICGKEICTSGSCTDGCTILDPIWYANWFYKRNITNFDYVTQLINSSSIYSASDITGNGDEWIYAYPCGVDNNSIYYNDSENLVIVGDDTTECFSYCTDCNDTVIYNTSNAPTGLKVVLPLDNQEGVGIDFSGNGHNATINGDGVTAGVAGQINDAYDFAGSDDYLTIADHADFTVTEFSVCAWANPDTADAVTRIMYTYDAASKDGFYLAQDGTGAGQWEFTVFINPSYKQIFSNNAPTGGWEFICGTRTSAGVINLYVDGAIQTDTDTLAGTMDNSDPIYIGVDRSITNDYNGLIDDLRFYSRNLNATEILALYQMNATLGAEETQASSTIDLLFANKSYTPYKSTFDEGEDFYVFANWTDENDLQLNDTVGSCNITLVNGILEVDGTDDNFTICDGTGGVCDYEPSYSEIFDMESIVGAVEDIGHASVCNEQLQQQDANVTLSCNAGAIKYSELRDGTTIPLCSEGADFVRVNTSICIGYTDLNLTVTYDGSYARRKRIEGLAIDRVFSTHELVAVYNDTLQLWKTPHAHEYYDHGNKTIYANCTHDTNSDYDNDFSEEITITNLPPVIMFGSVLIDGTQYDIYSGVSLGYALGIWNWSISVIDDDLDYINYTFYNSSSDTILFNESLTGIPLDIITSTTLFSDFANPYNLSVYANDSFGDITFSSMLFNVSDLANHSIDATYSSSNCIDANFTISAIYYHNVTPITGANLTLYSDEGNYSLDWDASFNDYRNIFSSNSSLVWDITINATSPSHPTASLNIIINIVECGSLTIRLWEEVETKTFYNASEVHETMDNYDKQLIDPYINEFATILAMNMDQNATGAYENCYLLSDSGQTIISGINYAGWLDSVGEYITDTYGDQVGCDNYWYKAEYIAGEAILQVPYIGNYSLFLLDGTASYENDVAPPNIAKSSLILPLGEYEVTNLAGTELDFWISHEELDWWGALTDSFFLFMVLVLPLLIFIVLKLFGLPNSLAGMVVISYELIWLAINTFV